MKRHHKDEQPMLIKAVLDYLWMQLNDASSGQAHYWHRGLHCYPGITAPDAMREKVVGTTALESYG